MKLRLISFTSPKTPRAVHHAAGLGVIALAAGFGYTLRAAPAGIPPTGALTYTGILTDANGTPLTSPQNVGIAIYDAQSAGNKRCERAAQSTNLDPAGRFQITMPDNCVDAVGSRADLWVEVSIASGSLGRSKIGAVPYAIEANNASTLQGLTASQLGPPSGIIAMFASACPTGWSLCDGSSGTPNLIGNFIKAGSTAALTSVSPTHHHTITNLPTSSNGGHHHYAEINWDANGPLYFTWQDLSIDSTVASGIMWTANYSLGVTGASAASTKMDNPGAVRTTDVIDHSHMISGDTSDVATEPKHITLVFCMKN